MDEYITWLEVGEPGYWRIVEYIQAIEKVIKPGDTFLELGTCTPSISDYFRRNYNCHITYAGIENHRIGTPLEKYFRKINMCTDSFGTGWCVVTATEVLEHLPCNLYKVRDKLVDAVKSTGYLFITAPVLGQGRGDTKLEDEFEGDWDTDFGHIKEFRDVDELKSLFEDCPCGELEIVDEWFAEIRARGAGSYCYNILYRKI